MTNYDIRIEVPHGAVGDILNRLQKAQEEIYKCYSELEFLGVVTIKEKPTDEPSANS